VHVVRVVLVQRFACIVLCGTYRIIWVVGVIAKVILDRTSGRSRGFGFVTFAENDNARDAVDAMNLQVHSCCNCEERERERVIVLYCVGYVILYLTCWLVGW
jgi:hypothetical protein